MCHLPFVPPYVTQNDHKPDENECWGCVLVNDTNNTQVSIIHINIMC